MRGNPKRALRSECSTAHNSRAETLPRALSFETPFHPSNFFELTQYAYLLIDIGWAGEK
jgi:hypothetical protein